MKKLFYLLGVCALLSFPVSADAKKQAPDDPKIMYLMMPDGQVLRYDRVLTDDEIRDIYKRWEKAHENC